MKHGRSGYTSVSQGGHSDDGMNYDDVRGKRKGHVPTFRTSKRGRMSEHSSVNTDDNTGAEDNTDFDTSSDQSYSRRGSVDYTVCRCRLSTYPSTLFISPRTCTIYSFFEQTLSIQRTSLTLPFHYHPTFVTHAVNTGIRSCIQRR